VLLLKGWLGRGRRGRGDERVKRGGCMEGWEGWDGMGLWCIGRAGHLGVMGRSLDGMY